MSTKTLSVWKKLKFTLRNINAITSNEYLQKYFHFIPETFTILMNQKPQNGVWF